MFDWLISLFGSKDPPLDQVRALFGSKDPPLDQVRALFGSKDPPLDQVRAKRHRPCLCHRCGEVMWDTPAAPGIPVHIETGDRFCITPIDGPLIMNGIKIKWQARLAEWPSKVSQVSPTKNGEPMNETIKWTFAAGVWRATSAVKIDGASFGYEVTIDDRGIFHWGGTMFDALIKCGFRDPSQQWRTSLGDAAKECEEIENQIVTTLETANRMNSLGKISLMKLCLTEQT